MLQEYLRELRKTRLLEPQEENNLWQQAAAGSLEAHHKLMTAYQPLVFKTAAGFGLGEAETMELIQEGMVGLLEAAEHFDYQRGVAFSIFAVHRIRGRMLDYLEKNNGRGLVYLEDQLESSQLLLAEQGLPVQAAERQLLQERLQGAMERLPNKEQQVLTRMFLEDRPAQEVAASINISLGHVYRLQKQGVRRIRGMLSKFIHEFNK